MPQFDEISLESSVESFKPLAKRIDKFRKHEVCDSIEADEISIRSSRTSDNKNALNESVNDTNSVMSSEFQPREVRKIAI